MLRRWLCSSSSSYRPSRIRLPFLSAAYSAAKSFALPSALATGYEYAGLGNPWVMFVIVGLITSVMTVFGDLVESVIKRHLGLKDMGKIMPGHGGILDRIDGTLFASTFVYIVFALFIVH